MSFERGDLFRGCGVNPDAPDEAPGDARSAAIDALGPASESLFQTAEQRWEAVLARDRTADGRFVYAVRTTGVYSNPSSSARLPKRTNVEFFDSVLAEWAAAYRARRRAASDQTTHPQPRVHTVHRPNRVTYTYKP